ncbi:MAG: glycoside hydrolase family 16 protein [Candidatus Saccharimonadales bacterium]
MAQSSNKKKYIVSAGIVAIVIGALVAINQFVFTTPDTMKTPTVAAASQNGRKLLFSDEFSGNKVDESKWNYCYDRYSYKYSGCTNYGNSENEWYLQSQVTQGAGNLILAADRQKTTGDNRNGSEQDYAYRSGMVSTGAKDDKTSAKWDGLYGYYEARILVPAGQAVWPAFWLLPTDRDWPPEIDIMEILGQKPHDVLYTYHWKKPDGTVAQDSSTKTLEKSTSDSWHTYAVNWQPGKLEWYTDGVLTKTTDSANVPSKRMQIIMNLAVGGTLPGEIDDTTPKKAVMLVDYVRVYDKK